MQRMGTEECLSDQHKKCNVTVQAHTAPIILIRQKMAMHSSLFTTDYHILQCFQSTTCGIFWTQATKICDNCFYLNSLYKFSLFAASHLLHSEGGTETTANWGRRAFGISDTWLNQQSSPRLIQSGRIFLEPALSARILTYTFLTRSVHPTLEMIRKCRRSEASKQRKSSSHQHHTMELNALWHFTRGLSNLVTYQVGTTSTSVRNTPFEPWIYTLLFLMHCYRPSSDSFPDS